MKETIKHAKKGWTLLIALLTAVTLVYGSVQAYDYMSTPNISGEWYITLTVESSSYKAYIGDVHGIKIYFTQADKAVTGNGEKSDYNGKKLNSNEHIKIDFDGNLNGHTFKTKYTLFGTKRETTGIFEAEITDGGKKLVGTFKGTAADSKGSITGVKIE
jgi:hypothetical protein